MSDLISNTFVSAAKGRTNTELREKFILSDNVMGQGMSGFVSKGPASGRKSATSASRSGTTTPVSVLCQLSLSRYSIRSYSMRQ